MQCACTAHAHRQRTSMSSHHVQAHARMHAEDPFDAASPCAQTDLARARQWAGGQKQSSHQSLHQSLHQFQTHKSTSPTLGLPKESMTRLLTQNQGVLAKPQASPRALPPPRLPRAASLSVNHSAPLAVAPREQGASWSFREGRARDSPGRGHIGNRGRANARIPSDEISDMYHSVLAVEAEYEDLASVPKHQTLRPEA